MTDIDEALYEQQKAWEREQEYLDSESAKGIADAEGEDMTIFNELDKARDLCPECDVDRNVVFGMLQEDCKSDNFQHAIKIIDNCEACKESQKAKKANLDWLCSNIP